MVVLLCKKHLQSISYLFPLQVADKIERYKKDGRPVAGCCVEPVQSAGGDNHASPWFFQQLQQICKEVNNVQLCLIVNILKYMLTVYIHMYFATCMRSPREVLKI